MGFSIAGEVGKPRSWTWEEFRALPSEGVTVDIHCVTKWSKLDTVWLESAAEHVVQFCDGGYTTNLPLEDVTGGKASSAGSRRWATWIWSNERGLRHEHEQCRATSAA